MKGIDISKAFFLEWGLPFLKQEFPGISQHIAAGRFAGSDALRADDKLSQDHSWGAFFDVYLDDDYQIDEKSLLDRCCAAAPSEFKGFRRRGGHDTAITLTRTSRFFEKIFGCIPESPRDWVCCTPKFEDIESDLYFLRHGVLFHDGSGRFSRLRAKFHEYPEDLRLLRLAHCFYDIAHYGQYNFVWRLVERGDVLAMQMALGHFVKAVLRLHFYLDNDFAPYWKWLAFEFRRRRYSPGLIEQLTALPTQSPAVQASEITAICDELGARVLEEGIVSKHIENPYRIPWFFMYREDVIKRITDPVIHSLTH